MFPSSFTRHGVKTAMRRKSRRVDAGRILSPSLVLGFIALLVLAGQGCGGDKATLNEGFLDRFDACERAVSLCGLSRDDLTPCVGWVGENFPNEVDRILLIQCMTEAPDCETMIEQCNLEGDWLDGMP